MKATGFLCNTHLPPNCYAECMGLADGSSTQQLFLLEDFAAQRGRTASPDYDALRMRLEEILGQRAVELHPQGRSVVAATVNARNQRELEKLRELVQEQLRGWSVIEQSQLSLPRTF